MRSIWTGHVSFGLVNVPVKLYGATEEHDVKAHQVHGKDGGRIRYKRVCECCGDPVEHKDIQKSYEHGEQTVILTEADLDTLPSEQHRSVEVLEFVPAGTLDPMLYEKSYFLGPEKGKHKAYVLLARALEQTGRVGLVQFAMRGKTRLAALTVLPKEGVLLLHTLRWPDEIRTATFKFDDVEIKDAELEMAGRVIESMANEYNADRYQDVYQAELRELIAAKADGGELPAVETAEDVLDDISDLMAKLEQSIKGREN